MSAPAKIDLNDPDTFVTCKICGSKRRWINNAASMNEAVVQGQDGEIWFVTVAP